MEEDDDPAMGNARSCRTPRRLGTPYLQREIPISPNPFRASCRENGRVGRAGCGSSVLDRCRWDLRLRLCDRLRSKGPGQLLDVWHEGQPRSCVVEWPWLLEEDAKKRVNIGFHALELAAHDNGDFEREGINLEVRSLQHDDFRRGSQGTRQRIPGIRSMLECVKSCYKNCHCTVVCTKNGMTSDLHHHKADSKGIVAREQLNLEFDHWLH